jgi:hypothetical protein
VIVEVTGTRADIDENSKCGARPNAVVYGEMVDRDKGLTASSRFDSGFKREFG